MHSSLKMALYTSNVEGQNDAFTELEDYLRQGQNPNLRDGSSTSLLELCIDYHCKCVTHSIVRAPLLCCLTNG